MSFPLSVTEARGPIFLVRAAIFITVRVIGPVVSGVKRWLDSGRVELPAAVVANATDRRGLPPAALVRRSRVYEVRGVRGQAFHSRINHFPVFCGIAHHATHHRAPLSRSSRDVGRGGYVLCA